MFPNAHLNELVGQGIISFTAGQIVQVHVLSNGATTVVDGTDSLFPADNTSTTIYFQLLN
jgi:hypothetical protein